MRFLWLASFLLLCAGPVRAQDVYPTYGVHNAPSVSPCMIVHCAWMMPPQAEDNRCHVLGKRDLPRFPMPPGE